MRKLRVILAGLTLVGSMLVVTATPAAAYCGLPKAGCVAYYKVCQVAYDADLLHCID